MPYCSRCGSQLNEDALFCWKCGAPTNPAAAQVSPTPIPTRRARRQHYHTMGPLTIAIIVIVAVVAVGSMASTWPTPFFPGPVVVFPGTTVGSGNLATKQENFTGFTKVSLSSGFRYAITQSGSYSIKVTTDDNVLNYVQVTQMGNILSVGLVSGHGFQTTTLKVEITMPDITGLDLSAGTGGTVAGFSLSHDFSIASSAGSSAAISGSASGLYLDASAGSHLDLSGFHVTSAHVDMSGGSWATINIDGRLDANLSGGSQLYYIGSPTMGSINSSGASIISKK
jgi:hypothetical protein